MTAEIYSNDFNRVIDATKFCTSTNILDRAMTRYIKLEFNAEHQEMTAFSCDGYRFSIEHAAIANCDENFVAYIKPTIKLPRSQYFVIMVDDNEVIFRGNDLSFGFTQPTTIEEFNYKKIIDGLPPRVLKIGFNGNYLLETLKAAKISAGNTFKKPVILEFHGEDKPLIIRTNKEDIKLVLPLRIKDEV